MSVKALIFSLGCVVAWFVLMPIIVVGGGLALLSVALLGEMGISLTGSREKALDPTAARATAHRVCLGSRIAR